MSEKKVAITVLMPAYNAGKYIAEAIQSVLSQAFCDFELLIINDGSTDNTTDIITGFTDRRIRLIDQDNLGVAAALNAGLAAAKAEIIARFDADDICMPDRLEKQFSFLQNNPDYILAGCDAEYIMENGEHLFDFICTNYTDEKIKTEISRHCPFIHSGVMYRKNVVLATGGYCAHAHSFEDHFLWAALLKKGKCCNLPYPLIKVRFNANSYTIDERWRSKKFRRIKQKTISTGTISEKEGNELARIIKQQETKKIKQGSYHALCCKKFLADNFQPRKAREHAGKAILFNPSRIDNYALLLASYLPQRIIRWLTMIKRAYN